MVIKELLEQWGNSAKHNQQKHTGRFYEFMLKMFGKRDKGGITAAQGRKARAIIMRSIRPFLGGLLRDKVIRGSGGK